MPEDPLTSDQKDNENVKRPPNPEDFLGPWAITPTTDDKPRAGSEMRVNIETSKDNPCDPEELERITYNLRDDLSELDAIEKVDLITKEAAPKSSKSGEAVMAGSLLVTLGASALSTVIPNLANTLQSWLTRHESRTISLEIGGDKLQLTGLSDKQQEKLIDAWVSRHKEKS